MRRRTIRRLVRDSFRFLLILALAWTSLPPGLLPSWLPLPSAKTAAAETLASPRFISAAVMPNGEVGLLFANGDNGVDTAAEIRFVRYTSERSIADSVQLSTAGAWYPQLAVLGSTLVAAYVDTRSPNAGKLVLRTSTDNGETWSAESNPFGSETFAQTAFVPLLVASHDGNTLYLFTSGQNAIPQYRSTTDLSSWTTAAAAGNSSMRVTTGNNCGNAGQECYRAHAFSFVETAVAGRWLYITKSDSGWGQSGRGTQYGTLGGSWSTQVDLGGSGGLSGGGESNATAFVAGNGDLYYLRSEEHGYNIYWQRSTDDGASWSARVYAYSASLPSYTTASPVGLYVAGYGAGEYVWWAGFGGSEAAARVVPLWSGPAPYADTATWRLFGSEGSDWDQGWRYPEAFGGGLPPRPLANGVYTTSATDLALPGRLLPFAFTRTYNSADVTPGPLGRGWTHSYNWSALERDDGDVEVHRGDGRLDRFVKQSDGSYDAPLGVFDALVRNSDGSFTLTTPQQVQYEFLALPTSSGYASAIAADDPSGYWRFDETSGSTVADQLAVQNGTTGGSVTRGVQGVAASFATFFSGSGYASIPSNAAFNFGTGDFSVEVWVYRTGNGTNSWPIVVSKRPWSVGSEPGWTIALPTADPTKVALHLGNLDLPNTAMQTATGFITANTWHHLALVYTASDKKGRLYVDTQLALTTPATDGTTGTTSSAAISVGRNNAGSGDYLQGRIDELAVYPAALSANQIAAHYQATVDNHGKLARIHEPAGNEISLEYTNHDLTSITDTVGREITLSYDQAGHLVSLTDPSGRTVRYGYDATARLTGVWDPRATAVPYASAVTEDSPAGYWRLDEYSGTTAADAQNVQAGTAGGGATRGVSGVAATAATSFDATGWITIPNNSAFNFGLGDFTLEAWVYRTGTGTGYLPIVMSKRVWSTGTEPGWSIALPTSDPTQVQLHLGNLDFGSPGMQSPTGLITQNAWHHLVVAYTSSDRKGRLYVDANLVLTTPATNGTTGATSTGTISIGRNNAGSNDYYQGTIDEVAVYARALTDTEVQAHYEANIRASWRYAYDGSSSHITSVADPDGRTVVTNTYDDYGRLATQQDGLSHETTFSYDGAELTITDPRGHDTIQTFDSENRLIDVEDTVGGTTYHTSYTYDGCGSRSSVTDRKGNRTDYLYDEDCTGDLLERDEPQLDPQTPRYATAFTYDTRHNPLTRTDAKGYQTSWTYDATTNVRLSQTQEIDGSTDALTKWEYGDSANPGLATKMIPPRGNTGGTPDYDYATVYSYDAEGNLESVTDADGNETTYGYDELGRRTSMVDSDGNASGGVPSEHTWTWSYDALDRLTSGGDPLGHETGYEYDGAGHQTAVTDKNGNVTSYTYDDAGRLATIAQKPDPSGQPSLVYTTTLTRDENGNVTSVEQANGVVTDYGYDALDRLTSMTTHPGSGTALTTSYTLDGNGNVTARTTADDVTTSYSYDNLNRLSTVAASGISTITYSYDELSRRTGMTDGTGSTTYGYDHAGRMTSAAMSNGTLGYAYDLDGHRTALGYPGSRDVTYTYSDAGRLTTVSDWASRQTDYTYTPSGLAATVTLPGGMVTTYAYDRAQRLTSLTNVLSGTTITSDAYTLDNEGNRTALSEYVTGITAGSSDSFGMSYDGLERLVAVTTTNAESFTLDGASNITARTGPAATYTIDDANRPTSDGTNTLTWTDADRLTGRGSDSFSYDALDRLTGSTVAGTARSYAYDGDGTLASRTTGGSSVDFLWDPATSPQRLLVSGADLIVYGLGPLYSVNGTTVTTFARDGQKSIRAELQGSTVIGSWRYRAYGEIAQSSGASTPAILGYAGQLLDPSALYYMRARWYDPSTARFATRDLIGLDRTASPPSFNSFGYALGNPVARRDPSGLSATTGGTSEGACVFVECGEKTRPYSYTTWSAAADTGTSMYLEEQSARQTNVAEPDYVTITISYGIAASYTRTRSGAAFWGLGIGTPGISLVEGTLAGEASSTEVDTFVNGGTAQIQAAAVTGSSYVYSPTAEGPHLSYETGAYWPPAVGVNFLFNWRVGVLAHYLFPAVPGPFGIPSR